MWIIVFKYTCTKIYRFYWKKFALSEWKAFDTTEVVVWHYWWVKVGRVDQIYEECHICRKTNSYNRLFWSPNICFLWRRNWCSDVLQLQFMFKFVFPILRRHEPRHHGLTKITIFTESCASTRLLFHKMQNRCVPSKPVIVFRMRVAILS